MENKLVHEIELYPIEKFNTLLNHEINRSRRYGHPVTLIHLAVETDDSGPDAQYGAENFAINVLNVQLRKTDIPCRQGNEFLVLMPSTDEKGGHIVGERLEKLFQVESQIYDKVSFKLFTYIGMATLSGDSSISSEKLKDHASQALKYASKNRLSKTVFFTDIK